MPVVESLVLLGAIGWVSVPLLTARLRRLFPRAFLAIAAAATAAAGGVILVAALRPGALEPLAVLALAGLGTAAWVGRDHFGRARRLPPGSLSVATSLRALVDREFYRRMAERHGPVFKMAQFHQPVVCVVGLDRAQVLLQQHEQSLGPSVQRLTQAIPDGFLRYMPTETHAVYGPLFRQALSMKVVAHAATAVSTATREIIDTALAGAAARDASMPADALLEEVVERAFVRALFGITARTSEHAAFQAAYARLRRPAISSRPTPAVTTALAELRALLAGTVDAWRRLPEDAPVSALSEMMRIDPTLPDATCIDNLVFIHKISAPNAVGLLRWLLATLGAHPQWTAALRESFQQDCDGAPLIDRVVMETLRLSQSEYLYRRLRKDVPFEGFVLPKGWLLRLCIRESHLSSSAFNDPDAFNPDRFLEEDIPRSAYMPFGGDRHACNGVALTNVICRAFLEALTTNYDWNVDDGAELDRDFRHWSHWRPSHRLRLRVRGRSSPIRDASPPEERKASATVP